MSRAFLARPILHWGSWHVFLTQMLANYLLALSG